jgi:hypothetical protein
LEIGASQEVRNVSLCPALSDNSGCFGTYERLKELGIEPISTINHGLTMSMYYADPDGNNIELQIDDFDTPEEAQEFLESDAFAENPIGVLFDPDELAARFEAGEPAAELVKRPVGHSNRYIG